MSHSEICPVCQGRGEIQSREDYSQTTFMEKVNCNGCGGRGWIIVKDNNDNIGGIPPPTGMKGE